MVCKAESCLLFVPILPFQRRRHTGILKKMFSHSVTIEKSMPLLANKSMKNYEINQSSANYEKPSKEEYEKIKFQLQKDHAKGVKQTSKYI